MWFPLLIPVFMYSLFSDGFVLAKLWLWYAVPLGARPIGWHVFAMAMGAYTILRATPNGRKDDRDQKAQLEAVLVALAVPWIVLLLGWWWA